jgi:NAD(P)-dependent dehydrogenase (short-subunit alcohol dehydrogenase family)
LPLAEKSKDAAGNMTSTEKPFAGLRAFVSASTRGPARVVAESWGLAGARVALHYRSDRSGAEESVRSFKAAGAKGLLLRLDLADESQAEMLGQTLGREFGGLDLVCFNLAMKPETAAGSEWRESLCHGWKHLAPLMAKSLKPRVLVLVSDVIEGVWAEEVASQARAVFTGHPAVVSLLAVSRNVSGGWSEEALNSLRINPTI